jgi:hypothetical protein
LPRGIPLACHLTAKDKARLLQREVGSKHVRTVLPVQEDREKESQESAEDAEEPIRGNELKLNRRKQRQRRIPSAFSALSCEIELNRGLFVTFVLFCSILFVPDPLH